MAVLGEGAPAVASFGQVLSWCPPRLLCKEYRTVSLTQRQPDAVDVSLTDQTSACTVVQISQPHGASLTETSVRATAARLSRCSPHVRPNAARQHPPALPHLMQPSPNIAPLTQARHFPLISCKKNSPTLSPRRKNCTSSQAYTTLTLSPGRRRRRAPCGRGPDSPLARARALPRPRHTGRLRADAPTRRHRRRRSADAACERRAGDETTPLHYARNTRRRRAAPRRRRERLAVQAHATRPAGLTSGEVCSGEVCHNSCTRECPFTLRKTKNRHSE